MEQPTHTWLEAVIMCEQAAQLGCPAINLCCIQTQHRDYHATRVTLIVIEKNNVIVAIILIITQMHRRHLFVWA